jgi:eukaryotic-like serine/threonine-protein kinase
MMLAGASPAEMLLGSVLDNGWKVIEKYKRDSKSTGGNFCVGYRVENSDGQQGFCKALDYFGALQSGKDPALVLEAMTANFNFERDILRKCDEYGMSRVIRILDSGTVRTTDSPFPVSYLIFEFAEFDIRKELDDVDDLEASLRLRTLHHIATGLKQLHAIRIAHQDLKPSNVLIVDSHAERRNCKLGDLGRATDSQVSAPHDDLPIAGDRNYAPPEQLYNATPVDFGPRRLACDLYHLGSLAMFMFTSLPMNAHLAQNLHPTHMWTTWTGSYDEVMPYVRDAFGEALSTLREQCPATVADRLTRLVGYLCEPDPFRRGYQSQMRNSMNPYGLERIVSEFDLLAIRAGMRAQGSKV